MNVDWTHGERHMWENHQVALTEASEAVADPDALLFDPDPKSRSAISARLLGYSSTAGSVLVVILVHQDDTAAWWGANAWRANSTDRRIYREGNTS